MEYTDGIETAAEYAAQALRLMTDAGIPQTPRNFAIWYTHVSGRDPKMSEDLEALVERGEAVSEEDNASIYEKYFGSADAATAVQETSQKIEESVNTVLGFMSEANDDAVTYGQSLESNLGEMASAKSMDSIRKAVESLVVDTKNMAQQTSLMQERLENSSQEIQTLRRHLEDVRKEAMTDGLTGIANRKFFDVTLRQEAMSAMETNKPLCLLLGDIDHFKKFNDNYGHQTGDQVLKLVAMILRDGVKGRDTAARYGGEEFAIILPATELDNAIAVGNQVRQVVASKRIRKKSTGEDFGAITMSLGVAKLRPGEPLSDFIQRADDGLYQAKRNGRNCVVPETELENASP